MMYMSTFWNFEMKYNISFQNYDTVGELTLDVVSEMIYFEDRANELTMTILEEYLS